jgi:hypothetical protein
MNSSSKALWLQESKQSVIGKREVQAATKMFARAVTEISRLQD